MLGDTVAGNYHEKDKSWNKKDLSLKSLKNPILIDEDKEGIQKRWKNEKHNCSNKNSSSTLSLHIAAYENSTEVDSNGLKDLPKKFKAFKSVESSLSLLQQNLFEFPRQQEGNGFNKSQVQQFRASQKLYAPNQGYFNMMPRFPAPSRPPLQQQQQPSEKALRSVYVGNIGFDVNEEELKQILSTIGPVIGFRIVHDRETGKSKGFGFCEYLDSETATRCIRQLNNLEFKGRNLRIDSAVLNERAMHDDFAPTAHSSMPPRRPPSPETSMYGPPPLNGQTPEAIAKTLSKCSPEIMFEVMRDMKNLATTNPQRCRQLLETNQQLAFALLQAQVMMHWLDTDAAFNLIDRKSTIEKVAEPPANMPSKEPPPHIPTRQPLRPTPTQGLPAPFRPPPPQQQQQPPEHQFFQHTPPLPHPQQQPPQQQQQFRQQFFPPQQQQQQPPPQPRPAPPSAWAAGPPQRMPGGPPPPQHFTQNQNFDRFPPPSGNDGPPPFNDSFRSSYGNRPSGPPPSNFHNMPPPPQRGHFPPPSQQQQSGGGFRPSMPPPPSHQQQQQQHFPPPSSHRHSSNDVAPSEDDEDFEMIQQLLQLTDEQISQLPPSEAAKVREIRAQLTRR